MGIPVLDIERRQFLSIDRADDFIESVTAHDHYKSSQLVNVIRYGTQVIMLYADTVEACELEWLFKRDKQLSDATLKLFGSRKRVALDGFSAPLLFDDDEEEE